MTRVVAHVGAMRESTVCAPGYAYPADPGYWPQDEGDLSDDGEGVCGIDMDDGMPVQYYRPCVKAVGPNRTEPDLRASTFARAELAATDVVATAYAAGAAKVVEQVGHGAGRQARHPAHLIRGGISLGVRAHLGGHAA